MQQYNDSTTSTPPPAISAQRLARMVGKIAIIIFVVEAAVMLALYGWDSNVSLLESILDSTMLTLASSPLIYIWVARPFAEEAAAARNELANQLAETRTLLDQNIRLKERLQQFSEISAEIYEQTLQRIGAELHDGPAQSLTFSLLQIDRLGRGFAQTGDTSKQDDLKKLRGVVHDTVNEIRGISTGLALPELGTLPLGDVIDLAVHRHKVATGVKAAVSFNSDAIGTQSQKACIYRVVQESLTNAFKHGYAATLKIQVDDTPDLTVTITDDGQGFEAGTVINKGLGLLGMRARVEALRGEFDVLSQPGQGTKVVARFNSKIVPHGAIHD